MKNNIIPIFKIKGKLQNYAWGGYQFIPTLIGVNNENNLPCAEYWMGAHPSASSILEESNETLASVIRNDKENFLTPSIIQNFGELPFLFKVLDVKDMLSIQVHPTKEEAEKGFLHEEELGIPINASNRNYKDKNHKPEIMIALGEFWLLHGFLSIDKIEKVINENIEFHCLKNHFNGNIKQLMGYVYNLSQIEADNILKPLLLKENKLKKAGELTKNNPGWWACKVFDVIDDTIANIDKGIFSIYFFNIVCAQKGEAVFQAAGIPHAYLEGQNIELMANSDNVLRGGLTPKHVDVPELVKHTIFEPVIPNVMYGVKVNDYERNYDCPVPDFDISLIELPNNCNLTCNSNSPEIILNINGNVRFELNDHQLHVEKGEVVFILPNTQYTIKTFNENAELYKAFVKH